MKGKGFMTPCKELRAAYISWNGGHSVWKGFPAGMKELGYNSGNRVYGLQRKQTNVYVGLQLKAEDDAPPAAHVVQEADAAEDPAPAIMDAAPALQEAEAEEDPAPVVVDAFPAAHVMPAAGQDNAVPVVEEVPAPDATNELVIRYSFSGAPGVVRIRKTDEIPPRVSVYDLIPLFTGAVNPRMTWRDLTERLGNSIEFSMHQFPGAGQRCTPVVDAQGVVKMVNNLSGPRAAYCRDACADIVVRYLEGDESLVQEIRENRVRMAHNSVLASIPHKPVKKKKDGVVYTVTTPLCEWVKIGMWTGRLERLVVRYRTIYGCMIELTTFPSEDCRGLESQVHSKLKAYRISGEVYWKGVLDYDRVIKCMQTWIL